jgi:protein O-GlcNAc transferase
MKKRIVSFSLFGSDPIYLQGALRNVRLLPTVYPGWTARVYVSEEIPEELTKRLVDLGAEVVRKNRTGLIDGMFWRFLPAAEADLEAVVVRDVDSRVTQREFAAVEEWFESGFSMHILRDHPLHKVVVLGGMWGCRGGRIPDMPQLVEHWRLWAKKGQDQDFLRDVIYPRFRYDCLVHSDFYQYAGESARAFPLPREGGEFMGCVYDADRDSLTPQQHAENALQLEGATLCRLPRARKQPKIYLMAEQWVRNLRNRVA